MTHISLPDDNWADLADPKKVTERKRKPVVRQMAALVAYRQANPEPVPVEGETVEATITQDELDIMAALTEAVMVAVVTAWSFPAEITLDGLQDLPGDAYDALRAACNASTLALMPDFSTHPDPKVTLTTGG